jgi:hypothetical protein
MNTLIKVRYLFVVHSINISDYFHFYPFSEGFHAPTSSRRFKWSQHICLIKRRINEIFTNNYFSIPLYEFDDDEEVNF